MRLCTIELIVTLAAIVHVSYSVKYLNRIVDSPSITCDPDHMIIKIKTSTTNPSKIYVDDFAEDKNCVARNLNRLAIPLGKCGMTTEKTDNKRGLVYRVCISVQLHPLFVTSNDHSYCAQCVYMASDLVEDLDETLAISDASASELPPEFDVTSSRPKCTYAIRRALEGPKVHYAIVGETVFHVWECQIEDVKILVQNCYVEDGQGNRILIIDENGCGIDQYILPTPKYAKDLRMAYQETPVFKFADKTLTRFGCQIRVCSTKDKCDIPTPPRNCPTYEERIALQRRLRDETHSEQADGSAHQVLSDLLESKTEKTLHEGIIPSSSKNHSRLILNDQRRSLRSVRAVLSQKSEPAASDGIYVHDSEVDVAGTLTILDSPEDVKFFEESLESTDPISCLSRSSYAALILMLVAFCSLHLLIGVLCAANLRYFRKTNNKKTVATY